MFLATGTFTAPLNGQSADSAAHSCDGIESAARQQLRSIKAEVGKTLRDDLKKLDRTTDQLVELDTKIRRVQEGMGQFLKLDAKRNFENLGAFWSRIEQARQELALEQSKLASLARKFSFALEDPSTYPAELAEFNRQEKPIKRLVKKLSAQLAALQADYDARTHRMQKIFSVSTLKENLNRLEDWQSKRQELLDKLPQVKTSARRSLSIYKCIKKREAKLAKLEAELKKAKQRPTTHKFGGNMRGSWRSVCNLKGLGKFNSSGTFRVNISQDGQVKGLFKAKGGDGGRLKGKVDPQGRTRWTIAAGRDRYVMSGKLSSASGRVSGVGTLAGRGKDWSCTGRWRGG